MFENFNSESVNNLFKENKFLFLEVKEYIKNTIVVQNEKKDKYTDDDKIEDEYKFIEDDKISKIMYYSITKSKNWKIRIPKNDEYSYKNEESEKNFVENWSKSFTFDKCDRKYCELLELSYEENEKFLTKIIDDFEKAKENNWSENRLDENMRICMNSLVLLLYIYSSHKQIKNTQKRNFEKRLLEISAEYNESFIKKYKKICNSESNVYVQPSVRVVREYGMLDWITDDNNNKNKAFLYGNPNSGKTCYVGYILSENKCDNILAIDLSDESYRFKGNISEVIKNFLEILNIFSDKTYISKKISKDLPDIKSKILIIDGIDAVFNSEAHKKEFIEFVFENIPARKILILVREHYYFFDAEHFSIDQKQETAIKWCEEYIEKKCEHISEKKEQIKELMDKIKVIDNKLFYDPYILSIINKFEFFDIKKIFTMSEFAINFIKHIIVKNIEKNNSNNLIDKNEANDIYNDLIKMAFDMLKKGDVEYDFSNNIVSVKNCKLERLNFLSPILEKNKKSFWFHYIDFYFVLCADYIFNECLKKVFYEDNKSNSEKWKLIIDFFDFMFLEYTHLPWAMIKYINEILCKDIKDNKEKKNKIRSGIEWLLDCEKNGLFNNFIKSSKSQKGDFRDFELRYYTIRTNISLLIYNIDMDSIYTEKKMKFENIELRKTPLNAYDEASYYSLNNYRLEKMRIEVNASIKKSILIRCKFVDDCNISNITIRDSKIEECYFQTQNIHLINNKEITLESHSLLERSVIENCTFINSDNLGLMVKFIKCNLLTVTFDKIYFDGGCFKHSNIKNSTFNESIFNCLASFDFARMEGSEFKKSKIMDTTFIEAELKNIHFNNCLLSGVSFSKAKLENVSFTGSILIDVKFNNAYLSNVDFGNSKLQNVDFNTKHNLDINSENTFYFYSHLEYSNLKKHPYSYFRKLVHDKTPLVIDIGKVNISEIINKHELKKIKFKTIPEKDFYEIIERSEERIKNNLFAFDECNGTIVSSKKFCIISGDNLFKNYSKIESIDLSEIDISNINSLSQMFKGCSKLKEIIFPPKNIQTKVSEKLIWMNNMLEGCIVLEKFIFPCIHTSKGFSMCGLFSDCISLKEFDLSNLCTEKVIEVNFVNMFNNCKSLEVLNLSNLKINTKYPISLSDCLNLKKIIIPHGFEEKIVGVNKKIIEYSD